PVGIGGIVQHAERDGRVLVGAGAGIGGRDGGVVHDGDGHHSSSAVAGGVASGVGERVRAVEVRIGRGVGYARAIGAYRAVAALGHCADGERFPVGVGGIG